MTMPGTSPYEYPIQALESDTDALQHVHNLVYLRWVQEAAAAHWAVLSNGDLNQPYRWVVLRHEIDYRAPAFAGEQLLVSTWVASAAGARSDRHTAIINRASGQLLAAAVTTWCLVDAITLRPRRIDAALAAILGLVP